MPSPDRTAAWSVRAAVPHGASVDRAEGACASAVRAGAGTAPNRSESAERAATEPGPGSSPTLCAVIVHYRCADALRACLASVAEHAPDMPVVVVENASGDASADRVRALAEAVGQVHVVPADANRGFGAGCNLGIAHALARFPALQHVLLLNPDTVLQAGCVAALRRTARQHPDAGIVGGRIESLDGARVLFANGRFAPWTLSRSHVPAPAAREFPTTFITGALMLIDAGLLRAGLRFDEQFFLYTEDLDLCCEVRARGRTLWITQDACVRHAEGGSQRDEVPSVCGLRPSQLRHMTRGKAYFARKRLPWLQRAVFFAVALLLKPLAGVWLTRSLRFLPIYFRALREGLRLPIVRGGAR